MSFTQTIVQGYVAKDPEMRYMANGNAVCNFSIPYSEKWKDKASGEEKEKTTWFRINIFGKLAEVAGQYVTKGTNILVIGKMESRKYQNKEGIEVESWQLNVDEMKLLGGGSGSGDKPQKREEPRKAAPSKKSDEFDDLDVPF